jgi:hypothetical protein
MSYFRILSFAKKKVKLYSALENEFQKHRHSPYIFRADEIGLFIIIYYLFDCSWVLARWQ